RPQYRLRGTDARAKSAVEVERARDGNPAAAQRRKESVRDCMARAVFLQDRRQYLVNHAPEARGEDLRRAGAVCDRERRGLTRRIWMFRSPGRRQSGHTSVAIIMWFEATEPRI